MFKAIFAAFALAAFATPALAVCPYDYNCLDNPYGAGNPYNGGTLYVVPGQ